MFRSSAVLVAIRAKYGLKQQELARLLAKTQTQMSQIEAAAVLRLSRKEIDKLKVFLGLTGEEYGQLLIAAGIFPTKEEMRELSEKISLVKTDLPVFLLDWAWFVRGWNSSADAIYGFSGIQGKSTLHFLEVVFISDKERGFEFRPKLEQVGGNSSFWQWYAGCQVRKFLAGNRYSKTVLQYGWYRAILARLAGNSEFAAYFFVNGNEDFDNGHEGEPLPFFSNVQGYSLLKLPAERGECRVFDVTTHKLDFDARVEIVIHFLRQ